MARPGDTVAVESPTYHGLLQAIESQGLRALEIATDPREGICLKELRETKRALKLTKRVPLVQPPSMVDPLLAETEELIKIFFVSIRTANKNVVREGTPEPYGDGL